jgi:hypothetical protein
MQDLELLAIIGLATVFGWWLPCVVVWAMAVGCAWAVGSNQPTAVWGRVARDLDLSLGHDAAGPTLTGRHRGRSVAIRVQRAGAHRTTVITLAPSRALPPDTLLDQHTLPTCTDPALRRVAGALLAWAPHARICGDQGFLVTLPGFERDSAELAQWLTALAFLDDQLQTSARMLSKLDAAARPADPATRGAAITALGQDPCSMVMRVERAVQTAGVPQGSPLQGGRTLLGHVGHTPVLVQLPPSANADVARLIARRLIPIHALCVDWDPATERLVLVQVEPERQVGQLGPAAA